MELSSKDIGSYKRMRSIVMANFGDVRKMQQGRVCDERSFIQGLKSSFLLTFIFHIKYHYFIFKSRLNLSIFRCLWIIICGQIQPLYVYSAVLL